MPQATRDLRPLGLLGREQYVFECPPKVQIEDGVDDGVECRVDVAQPDKAGEEHVGHITLGPFILQVVADTDGVDDVDGEEGYPADKEDD